MGAALASRIEPIRVKVGHPRPCMAAECEIPAKAVVVWLQMPRLEAREICAGHLLAFRDVVKERGGGAVFFPVDAMPSMEVIKQAVEREIARRQPPQPFMYATGGNAFTNATFSFTTTGW